MCSAEYFRLATDFVFQMTSEVSRPIHRSFSQLENLQLSASLAREQSIRLRAWKRYQDTLTEERRQWPPPANGVTYNQREEAIYSISSEPGAISSWFQRVIYENELSRGQHHLALADCSRVKTPVRKETVLEREVKQLRARLQLYLSVNDDTFVGISENRCRQWSVNLL